MPTDTDTETEVAASEDESLEELRDKRATPTGLELDPEDFDTTELDFEEVDLGELDVKVLPKQADEFTCANCFLVRHRSQLVHTRRGDVCVDCS